MSIFATFGRGFFFFNKTAHGGDNDHTPAHTPMSIKVLKTQYKKKKKMLLTGLINELLGFSHYMRSIIN